MRILAAFVLVGSIVAPAVGQVDPGVWIPMYPFPGSPSTLEHVDSNGVHTSYLIGATANCVTRDGHGNVYIAETPGIGGPSRVHVFRAGLGKVAVLGPYATINGITVDAQDRLWLREPQSLFFVKFECVDPTSGASIFASPLIITFDASCIDSNGNLLTFTRFSASGTTQVQRYVTDGTVSQVLLPFLAYNVLLTSTGDYVCYDSSSLVRVVTPKGAPVSAFSMSANNMIALALEPGDVLSCMTDPHSHEIERWRLDGVKLASVPLPGTFLTDQVYPATDGTRWVFRADPIQPIARIEQITASGAVLHSFEPSLGDKGTAYFSSGDMTGAQRVLQLAPGEDSDFDGAVNAAEVEVGANPLSSASVPPKLSVTRTAVLPTKLRFDIADSARPSAVFAVLAGFNVGTGLMLKVPEPIPQVPIVPIDLLAWMNAGALNGPPFVGVLDAAGTASFQLTVPPLPFQFDVRFSVITVGGGGAIAPSPVAIVSVP